MGYRLIAVTQASQVDQGDPVDPEETVFTRRRLNQGGVLLSQSDGAVLSKLSVATNDLFWL